MLIACPTCATSYEIPSATLGAGRQVRCAQCKNIWFATPESMAEDVGIPAVAAAEHDAAAALPDSDGRALTPADIVPSAAGAPPHADNTFTITDAPPLAPHDQAEDAESSTPKFDPGVPDHIETAPAHRDRPAYAARKERLSLTQRLLNLPLLILLLSAVLVGALNWRAGVVRHFPQSASLFAAIGLPVNLRGLYFENVRSTAEVHDGVTVLVVEGTIVNLTTRTLEVPRLRLSLRSGAGHEVYAWTALPPKGTLSSGNGLPFRARLASPPPDGRDVIVRFFNRRDSVAGL